MTNNIGQRIRVKTCSKAISNQLSRTALTDVFATTSLEKNVFSIGKKSPVMYFPVLAYENSMETAWPWSLRLEQFMTLSKQISVFKFPFRTVIFSKGRR